jgi:hypothetical protein
VEGKIVSIHRDRESLLFLVLHEDGNDYWLEQLFTEAATLVENQVVVVDGYYPSHGYVLAPAQSLTNVVRDMDPEVFKAHKSLSEANINKLMTMRKHSKY